jgi:tetratricopeptide (TPR) repeat protein
MLHPLSQEVALRALNSREPARRQQLDLRIADWYATTSRPEGEWHDLEDVLPQQLEFRHRMRADDVNGAASVLCTIDDFLILRGFVGRVGDMHMQVAGRITDDAVRVRHLVGMGIVRIIGGPALEAPAILTEARDLAVEVGDRLSEGQALHWLGDWQRQQRDLVAATKTLSRATELLCEIGTTREALHALQALALAHIYSGDVQLGLAVCDRIMQTATDAANSEGIARADDTRSLAFLVSGRYEESLAAVNRAIEAYNEAGVPESLTYLRNVQGLVRLAQHDHLSALESFTAAHQDAINIGSPRPIGMCLFNMAVAHWTASEFSAAAAAAARAAVALERQGGADLEAARALERACRWRLDGDEPRAAEAVRQAAGYVRGNPDLASPPDALG